MAAKSSGAPIHVSTWRGLRKLVTGTLRRSAYLTAKPARRTSPIFSQSSTSLPDSGQLLVDLSRG